MNRAKILGFLCVSGFKYSNLNFPTPFLALLFSSLKIAKSKCFFLIPTLVMMIFLLYHYSLGNITIPITCKNFFRLVLPFIVSAFVAANFSKKPKELINFANGILLFCFLDIMPPVMLNLAGFVDSIIVSNIYFIKDKNLFLQNTNYTAFFCFTACFACLVAKDSLGLKVNLQIWTSLLLTTLCMSRAYLVAILTMILISRFPVGLSKILFKKKITVSSFILLLAIQIGLIINLNLDSDLTDFIRKNVDGSAATKFEIAAYTSAVIKNYGMSILTGLGPQVVDGELVRTYASHSLIGIFPELGIGIFIYIIPFFILASKYPKYFLYNLGFLFIALNVSFPLAYITPWLIITYFATSFVRPESFNKQDNFST